MQAEAPTRQLTMLYLLALSTVALLCIVGQLIVQHNIDQQSMDSQLINIAGRQRMLSQKITKLALILQTNPSQSAQHIRTDELRLALSTWELTHQRLLANDTALQPSNRNSPEVQRLFDDVLPHFEAMTFSAHQILFAEANHRLTEIFVERLLNHEDAFLQAMESLVAQYQREAEERVSRLHQLELFLLIMTLIVLALEALFVFRPAVKQLQRTIFALADVQEKLRAEKELVEVTLGSIGDGVITTNAQMNVLWLNPVAEQLTGWNSEEAFGQSIQTIFPLLNEKTREIVANPIEHALLACCIATLPRDTMLIARDGIEVAIDDSASPIRNATGEVIGAVLVFRDVTHERELDRQLTWQATHDPLTALANRRDFEHRIDLICQGKFGKDQFHALCCIDLDRFKAVNDTGGHRAGDALLCEVAALLKREVRPNDTVARLGGDEFGILLYDCGFEDAAVIAERLLAEIKNLNFAWEEHQFSIGASIGLAPVLPFCNLAEVLHAADTACYVSKHQGRNRVSYAS